MKNRYHYGQIVKSKAGHDKGDLLVIIAIEEEYVYLVDGNLRKLEKPKKKNKRHIQIINYIDEELVTKKTNNELITNQEIINAIKLYEAKVQV